MSERTPRPIFEDVVKRGRPTLNLSKLTKLIGGADAIKASVYFSQIVYWHELRTDRDGIWKTETEMYRETGLSVSAQRTARAILKKYGLLKVIKKGLPNRNFYMPNVARYNALIDQYERQQREAPRDEPVQCYDMPTTDDEAPEELAVSMMSYLSPESSSTEPSPTPPMLSQPEHQCSRFATTGANGYRAHINTTQDTTSESTHDRACHGGQLIEHGGDHALMRASHANEPEPQPSLLEPTDGEQRTSTLPKPLKPATKPDRSSASGQSSRARNEQWDALVQWIGYSPSTPSACSLFGKVAKELRTAGATFETIIEAGKAYDARHPDWERTPTALAKWYDSLLQPSRTRQPAPQARNGQRPTAGLDSLVSTVNGGYYGRAADVYPVYLERVRLAQEQGVEVSFNSPVCDPLLERLHNQKPKWKVEQEAKAAQQTPVAIIDVTPAQLPAGGK